MIRIIENVCFVSVLIVLVMRVLLEVSYKGSDLMFLEVTPFRTSWSCNCSWPQHCIFTLYVNLLEDKLEFLFEHVLLSWKKSPTKRKKVGLCDSRLRPVLACKKAPCEEYLKWAIFFLLVCFYFRLIIALLT